MHKVHKPAARARIKSAIIAATALGASTLVFLGLGAGAASAATDQYYAAVMSKDASLPSPTTQSIAASNQAALQPYVDAVVQHGGPGDLQALADTKNPDVLTDLLSHATVSEDDADDPDNSPPPPASPTGASPTASGCWGSHHTRYIAHIGPLHVGWRQVTENGWCGNGHQITWNGGGTFRSWTLPGYCWQDVSTNYSFDGSPNWIHGENYGRIGGDYLFGCAGLQTIAPAIRIAGNGHWDRYNDF